MHYGQSLMLESIGREDYVGYACLVFQQEEDKSLGSSRTLPRNHTSGDMDHCVLHAVDEIGSSHATHCTQGTALIRGWMWSGGQADAGKIRAQTLVGAHGGERHRIQLSIRNAA